MSNPPSETFEHSSDIAVPVAELADWHLRPGAFQRLQPPWENVTVVEEPDEITDGARAVVEVKILPLPIAPKLQWVAEHCECIPGKQFADIQKRGPFAAWKHTHHFERAGTDASRSRLTDAVEYRLPLGAVGKVVAGGIVKKRLRRMFHYRHAVTQMDLERQSTEPTFPVSPATILVTGATGMIGGGLEAYLRMRGHRVQRVTRSPSRPGDIAWDPDRGEFDLKPTDRIDAVVHLAGESVAGGRWSDERKRRILESRRLGTRLLCAKLAELETPPRALISASGVNYYPLGNKTPSDEQTERGSGFLADVCQVWEEETQAASDAGIRVANLRLGMVLSPSGGALRLMLPAFTCGVGGRLGKGTQRMAWVALDDVIDVASRALFDDRYIGPVNVVSPQVVTNSEFTQVLASVLRRPAIFRVPGDRPQSRAGAWDGK